MQRKFVDIICLIISAMWGYKPPWLLIFKIRTSTNTIITAAELITNHYLLSIKGAVQTQFVFTHSLISLNVQIINRTKHSFIHRHFSSNKGNNTNSFSPQTVWRLSSFATLSQEDSFSFEFIIRMFCKNLGVH